MSLPTQNLDRTAILARDIRKYLAYFLEREGLTRDLEPPRVSDAAVQAARSIRGKERRAAIMLHGIMPRSGTVYLGQLLRLHPDIYAYPHRLWETPLLPLSPTVSRLGRRFLLEYKPNIGKFGQDDLLPLMGAAFLAHLYQASPAASRILVKTPSVEYITHFFSMFPHENLLLLLRDGRDLVHSTLRTWPKLNFVQVCLRWRRSAQAVLRAIELFEECHNDSYMVARFENVVQNPSGFVQEVCSRFDLDPDLFPFGDIGELKVIGSSKLAEPGEEVSWRWIPKPEGFEPMEYWRDWPWTRKMIFKLIAGRALVDLGYSEDLSW